jgi:acyl-CoA thioesterase FadM
MDPREDRFIVEAFDCRPDGCVKPNALLQYLQEAAARHAEQLGVGFADLSQWDCFWVLLNLRLEMTDTPRWRECLTIRTWPSGCTRLTAAREFVGAAADGRELFRAASEWMILDKNSSRPRNLSRMDLNLPPTGRKVLGTELRRLQRMPAPYTNGGTISVPFSTSAGPSTVCTATSVTPRRYARCKSPTRPRSLKATRSKSSWPPRPARRCVWSNAKPTARRTRASVFWRSTEQAKGPQASLLTTLPTNRLAILPRRSPT